MVTSTNRDLKKRVEEGKFREDLFYRLNVVPIYVPPLRERPDDIPILARYFLKKFNTENNKNIRDFSPEVLEYFMKHPWTGNVRELENAIEYSVVLCRNEIIKPEHLPPLLKDRQVCEPQPSATSDKVSLKDTEKEQIIKTLGETEWNYTRTAKTLGISRSTLHNKLKEYQIEKR